MGTTYRFLATVGEAPAVLEWFRCLPEEPAESQREAGAVFFFRDFGPLRSEPAKSPLVSVFLPVRRRGVLTTVGEVHFLATPLSAFPGLNRVNKRFREWLSRYLCVYSRRPGFVDEWHQYLEGSTRNWDSDIFALPEGLASLRRGDYFVAQEDGAQTLDLVCRRLQMRGVIGIEQTEPGVTPDHRPPGT